MKKCLTLAAIYATLTRPLVAAENFTPPASPRATFNFNPGWKFFKSDVTNAEQVAFDDSKWSEVSAPHTYNDTDSYTQIISHSGGDRHAYAGIAWYRKHFKLPTNTKDGKVFLEFAGLKQAGRFWVNGKFAGKYENGVTPCGLDLTEFVNFGETENVIAVKTVYVAADHCDAVELFVNGKSKGVVKSPMNGYIFAFPEIKFEAGKISAVAKANGKIVTQNEIETAGAAKRLKLTPHTNPNGLQADGADVAFFDVEVVDAQGRRCPTDEARVDFKLDGPAIWRGGYNSGKTNSVNNLWLDTECGVNRVAIRSTLTPGTVTLTATRDGLEPAKIQIASKPVEIQDGLAH